MKSPRTHAIGWLLGLLAAAVTAAPAAAQPSEIDIEVLVAHISDEPGAIDPRGRKLHEKLSGQFRYESLSVLESRRLSLGVDAVGGLTLPNGKRLQVRPLQVDERGVLLAVGVEGTLQSDLRVRNGHLVVIGAERHQDGKLVISLEPRW